MFESCLSLILQFGPNFAKLPAHKFNFPKPPLNLLKKSRSERKFSFVFDIVGVSSFGFVSLRKEAKMRLASFESSE